MPGVVFYGWWIVFAGAAIEFVLGGLFVHAYGAYVVVLRAEFGWSATLLSSGFALVRVEQGLLGPLQGWLVDRYGPRRVINAGLCLIATGLLLFSQISGVEAFFAALVVIAVGASLAGFPSVAVAIINWFERRRSTAFGLTQIGTFAGPLLLPAVVLGFSLLGWRATAALSAAAVLLIAVPVAQVIRHRPETYGMAPDGVSVRGGPTASLGEASQRSLTMRGALRVRQFWYLSLGHTCALMVVSAVLVHFVPQLNISLGLSLGDASRFVLMLSVVTVTGTLVGGAIGDRFGRRDLVVACMGAHALSLLVLAQVRADWMIVVFVLLHGLAWGIRGPLMPAIRADFFGKTAFGAISGMSGLIVMAGNISGPLIAGLTFDLTGSYVVGFSVLAAFAAMGAVFFVLAWQTVAPRRP